MFSPPGRNSEDDVSGAPGADRLRPIFELRRESWFSDEVYQLLNRHGVALCIANSTQHPRREVTTTGFQYFRFHGPTRLFTSNYTRAELAEEAKKMRPYMK